MGRGLVIAVCIATVITACTSASRAPTYRSETTQPFALWPEDDPALAEEACGSRDEDEAWRTTPEGVAEVFVRQVLGWNAPDVEDVDVRAESPGTAVTAFDESFPGSALGLVIHLRRLHDCWFVRSIQPREGFVPVSFDFDDRDGRPAVAVTWEGEGPQIVELGYGGESERKVIAPGETAIFYVENTEAVGHYVSYPPAPSERSQGYPLEPWAVCADPDAVSCD